MTNDYCLTGHALTRTIAVTVSSSTAGMVAGARRNRLSCLGNLP
jgi:hypothetical protein